MEKMRPSHETKKLAEQDQETTEVIEISSTGTEDSADEHDECNKGKGKRVHVKDNEFDGCPIVQTDSLPVDIDGKKVFKLSYKVIGCSKQVHNIPKDGRKWQKAMPTKRKSMGTTKIRLLKCHGQWECVNSSCIFKAYFGKSNRHYKYFNSSVENGKSVKLCIYCDQSAVFSPCYARKIVEFNDDTLEVTVKHIGTHVCTFNPVVAETCPPADEYMKTHPKAKPRVVQRQILLQALRTGTSVTKERLLDLASQVLDKTAIRNKRQHMNASGSIEPILVFKAQLVSVDRFFIYKVNDERSNDQPTYVFKTSKCLLELALQMDLTSNTILSKEYAFFDGKWRRVKGYLTIGLHVYHPLLMKIVRIASMDIKATEDTKTIATFFNLLNEAIKEVSEGKKDRFNPVGFVCDENGANFKALHQVYGPTVLEPGRILTCVFHFKQSVHTHARRLKSFLGNTEIGEEEAKTFIRLSHHLVNATTIVEYDKVYQELSSFISQEEYRTNLLSHWLEWWHTRREHICTALKPPSAPNVNLSETYHSTYQTTDSFGLSLLHAAHDDTADALLVESGLREMERGNYRGGTGPNQGTRENEQRRRKEAKRAKEMAEDITSGSPSTSFTPDESCTHRPDKRKNPKQGDTKNKKRNNSRFDGDTQRAGRKRPKKSSTFMDSLKKAKKEKLTLKSQRRINQTTRSYEVQSVNSLYTVTIQEKPSCTCPFKTQKPSQLCKHIIWVYLNVLSVGEDDDALFQIGLTTDEVKSMLDKAGDTSNSSTTNDQNRIRLSDMEIEGILRADRRNSDQQDWKITKLKSDSSALCAGCKASAMVKGRLCIIVHGLYVPGPLMKAVPRKYYFCAMSSCVSKKPYASNLRVPPANVLLDYEQEFSQAEMATLRSRGFNV